MRDETKLDVYTSGITGAEYDAGMKHLMGNKEIIIPILQMTVPEFKTCSQEEILQCNVWIFLLLKKMISSVIYQR